MHPAVFDGVTKREERNGGAYSNTKRLTMSNTKILLPDRADNDQPSSMKQMLMNSHEEIHGGVSCLGGNLSEWNIRKDEFLEYTISVNVGGAADRSFHQASALHMTRMNNTPGGGYREQ